MKEIGMVSLLFLGILLAVAIKMVKKTIHLIFLLGIVLIGIYVFQTYRV